jgi:hypothetical protein
MTAAAPKRPWLVLTVCALVLCLSTILALAALVLALVVR